VLTAWAAVTFILLAIMIASRMKVTAAHAVSTSRNR